MSQKQPKPTLGGRRIRTRKRGRFTPRTRTPRGGKVSFDMGPPTKKRRSSELTRTLFADEKVKYEPQTFRDEIIDGINKAEGDLKKVEFRKKSVAR